MIRIGTRGSQLALAQARAVAAHLAGAGEQVEIVPVRTEGDRRQEVQLAAIGGKGLFVREIEEMLLSGGVDCAVHSLKDLPAQLPPGLVLAAFPEREDARDVLVTREPARLESLRPGARIGTGSPRRRALALALRPDLVVEPVRGNVDTRLRKLASEGWDGVLLAASGLKRLGLAPAQRAAARPGGVRAGGRAGSARGRDQGRRPPRASPARAGSTTRRRGPARWPSANFSAAWAPRATRRWPPMPCSTAAGSG